MTALHVVAHLRGPIAAQSASLMLDSLLMAAVARRDGMPPLDSDHRGPASIDIPIERSACGRVFLCSRALGEAEAHALKWKNRRFPIYEAQLMGAPKLKRINITGGPCRSYRIPMDTVYMVDDELHWWAIGDARGVEELLTGWVSYLGHKRSVGLGRVMHWHVEECDPWEGFPVVRDGKPTRPLPVDWPGLSDNVEHELRCLLPPYWRRAEEDICAV